MLMTISSVQQGSGRTDFDAVPALRTIQPAAERANHRVRAALAGLDRFFTHPFIADAGAPFAQDATRRIVGDHRRQILFGLRVLSLNESFFEIPPIKGEFLQLAFAPAIAD